MAFPERRSPDGLPDDAGWSDHSALAAALGEPIPRIPPVYGYDERGSELFEDITRLPTYYLTRVEWDLLRTHAREIAAELHGVRFAELGSGSGKKTRTLLAEGAPARPAEYLPVDVSAEMLQRAAAVAENVPGLVVRPLRTRYEAGLAHLREHPGERLVIGFLGANVGNTTRAERAALLAEVAAALRPGDGFLVSADLRKPGTVFTRAYNDPPGASAFADFRRNHLVHLNRLCGADFVPGRFVPVAHYDEGVGEVHALLHVRTAHEARVPAVGRVLRLDAGAAINVGISAKFDHDAWQAELAAHGLHVRRCWSDQRWQYAIYLAERG
ncbi:L-histidine Nalpha-methyltransferase [Pseudonocardia thermophila]|jgi:Uncharacterized conserved protein|uniref:L-histidine Nalpha-methyltransferase n=1 Tax=Pseudonocardia thermophila TaxID=1848 RepID=A0A1M6SZC4_PSETH|nr:L-histidine N(alpha)-methyltransferase [Pseudonocardia thermophila]SHK50074.1 L-histidine Nalpha-methyltransferase [Pseudonocardia thermophila]